MMAHRWMKYVHPAKCDSLTSDLKVIDFESITAAPCSGSGADTHILVHICDAGSCKVT